MCNIRYDTEKDNHILYSHLIHIYILTLVVANLLIFFSYSIVLNKLINATKTDCISLLLIFLIIVISNILIYNVRVISVNTNHLKWIHNLHKINIILIGIEKILINIHAIYSFNNLNSPNYIILTFIFLFSTVFDVFFYQHFISKNYASYNYPSTI